MTFPSHPEIDEAELDRILYCCEKQHAKITELREALTEKARRLELADAELSEMRVRLSAEAQLRPSLEVLQRMANGIDPYDKGRFAAAVAALPHETPKLSASVNTSRVFAGSIGARFDAAEAARARGLRLIRSPEPEPLDAG